MFDTDGDLQTGTETDSQTETETDSQTETETNSQTEIEMDSHTDEQTGSQTRTVTMAQIEPGSARGDSMVDLSCSQTNVFSIMADVHVQPTRKRRRTETSEISTETYDVTDYRPTQHVSVESPAFLVAASVTLGVHAKM